MASWSQLPAFQALGWAMLNSLWQMAMLAFCFSLVQQFSRFSARRLYYIALGCLAVGSSWFIYTFLVYFSSGAPIAYISSSGSSLSLQNWQGFLSAASSAYVFLLVIPASHLVRNWRYINQLKSKGLEKPSLQPRLFVRTIAQRLGIKKPVQVYISSLVSSPLTIGCWKPIILLPIAALNNLTSQQVEAILLHELSHIRRFDYVVNFIITVLQAIFYFNPFVKKLVSAIEFEREKCCDELVMQFQYDTVSYASALLTLEKSRCSIELLTLAAAGKNHLLRRVERILGLAKPERPSLRHLAPLSLTLLVIILIQSLLIIGKEAPQVAAREVFTAFTSPVSQFEPLQLPAQTFSKPHATRSNTVVKSAADGTVKAAVDAQPVEVDQNSPLVSAVEFDATTEMVSPEEQVQIDETIDKAKTVLAKAKWKELESEIPDGLTYHERVIAHNEYLTELNKIDWERVNQHLRTGYNTQNWGEITAKLNAAILDYKLDSLHETYQVVLDNLAVVGKLDSVASCQPPVPDVSQQKISSLKLEVQSKIDSILTLQQKKIIKF